MERASRFPRPPSGWRPDPMPEKVNGHAHGDATLIQLLASSELQNRKLDLMIDQVRELPGRIAAVLPVPSPTPPPSPPPVPTTLMPSATPQLAVEAPVAAALDKALTRKDLIYLAWGGLMVILALGGKITWLEALGQMQKPPGF